MSDFAALVWRSFKTQMLLIAAFVVIMIVAEVAYRSFQ